MHTKKNVTAVNKTRMTGPSLIREAKETTTEKIQTGSPQAIEQAADVKQTHEKHPEPHKITSRSSKVTHIKK
jgi:hypothetical protein